MSDDTDGCYDDYERVTIAKPSFSRVYRSLLTEFDVDFNVVDTVAEEKGDFVISGRHVAYAEKAVQIANTTALVSTKIKWQLEQQRRDIEALQSTLDAVANANDEPTSKNDSRCKRNQSRSRSVEDDDSSEEEDGNSRNWCDTVRSSSSSHPSSSRPLSIFGRPNLLLALDPNSLRFSQYRYMVRAILRPANGYNYSGGGGETRYYEDIVEPYKGPEHDERNVLEFIKQFDEKLAHFERHDQSRKTLLILCCRIEGRCADTITDCMYAARDYEDACITLVMEVWTREDAEKMRLEWYKARFPESENQCLLEFHGKWLVRALLGCVRLDEFHLRFVALLPMLVQEMIRMANPTSVEDFQRVLASVPESYLNEAYRHFRRTRLQLVESETLQQKDYNVSKNLRNLAMQIARLDFN